MPRYDLMHWSQRVRDQQATHRSVVDPQVDAKPVRTGTANPRAKRPKPPRDESADYLLRLCREGRLFELQTWVAEGKPLALPIQYRHSLLRIALDTGFHSLIEFLLRHESDPVKKDELLRESCFRNQAAAMQLALKYGARVESVSFQDVIETWDRNVVQTFLERGADPITNAPFARAFKSRVKTALGSYLDCKRARPELADGLQAQADAALRQACQDEDLKWICLLVWLGADARSKGLATDDLDNPDALADESYHQSALQIACGSRKPEILRKLKPDPAKDDLRELMTAAASFFTTPETVAHLVSLGADINDKADGGSTALDRCVRSFGWTESVLEAPYLGYRHSTVPVSRLNKSLEALHQLLQRGARWTPDVQALTDARRSLYRLDADAITSVLELLRTYQACKPGDLDALIRTPKMRGILRTRERERAQEQLARELRVKSKRRPVPRLFHCHYDRQRLYEEVWAAPTQKVAERYGVSDVAIAKACRVLGVPKPPRGYWAKKAAGHKLPKKPPLARIEE